MENTVFNKDNGLWYEKHGEYYLPSLTLPSQEEQPIGVWGQRHLQYLKKHRRGIYTTLLTECKLNTYLADIDNQANEMLSRLVKDLSEKEGVTEALKASDQMEWVQRMNSIRQRAEEIVNADLIYA